MMLTEFGEKTRSEARQMKPHEHVILEIARERERQMSSEGWSPEHDDAHANGEMAVAAGMYALNAPRHGTPLLSFDISFGPGEEYPLGWPWHRQWWKPKSPRRDLVRAAALIVAEIERIDRARKSEK